MKYRELGNTGIQVSEIGNVENTVRVCKINYERYKDLLTHDKTISFDKMKHEAHQLY